MDAEKKTRLAPGETEQMAPPPPATDAPGDPENELPPVPEGAFPDATDTDRRFTDRAGEHTPAPE